ncbi:MAG: GNAT family N-acetyltransferase [Armatimonadetes bacterium]|nr:GNAT family N-acetyltransferase [Armatimonadota bacterium]
MLTVRSYRHSDEASLVALWNAALLCDPIEVPTFRRKVLLDPNFDREWLLVAETEGGLAGFCLCLRRRVPMGSGGLEPERGWITAYGVAPECRRQGVGSALLDRALDLLRSAGRREVLVAPYTPNYFVPGVDEAHYAEGLAFLRMRGFEVTSRPLSMDANIVLFDYAPYQPREEALRAQGIEVRALRGDELPLLLAFLEAHASPDWLREARELLIDTTRGLASLEQITVAVRGTGGSPVSEATASRASRACHEVVGYCQFRGEHFGPFGVREDLRGQGVGTVLLAKCLQTMREHGLHNAWVLWTSDENADRVYSRFGFRETRRFAVLRYDLGRDESRPYTRAR